MKRARRHPPALKLQMATGNGGDCRGRRAERWLPRGQAWAASWPCGHVPWCAWSVPPPREGWDRLPGGRVCPQPLRSPALLHGLLGGGVCKGSSPSVAGSVEFGGRRAGCVCGWNRASGVARGPRFILRLGPGRTSPLGPGAPEPSVRLHTARHGLSLPPSGRRLVNCSDQTLPTASWLWTDFPLIYLASE